MLDFKNNFQPGGGKPHSPEHARNSAKRKEEELLG
jgi:hypothetical protein